MTTQADIDEAQRLIEAVNTFTKLAMDSRDYRDREAMQQIVRHAIRDLGHLVGRCPALQIKFTREWEEDFKLICQATASLRRETERRR